MTVAYAAVLGMLVQGHVLDRTLSGKLMKLVKTGKLPFHAVTFADLQPPRPGDPDPIRPAPADLHHQTPCSRRPTWPRPRRMRASA